MSKAKRNYITPQRRAQLEEAGAVYVIGCGGSHCNCHDFGKVCRRGFFSLWIQAVYGLYFAKSHRIPAYVDFGNRLYLYSDPHRFPRQNNLWDCYYRQHTTRPSGHKSVHSRYIEDYPLRIWQKDHLQRVHHEVISGLRLQPQAATYIDALQQRIKAGRTLGLQVRHTDHPAEIEPVGMEPYLKILRQSQDRFDFFFIATDDMRVIEMLVREWGRERIIFQQAIRSADSQAVHTNMQHPQRYRLGLEVLADCYALSVCERAVLVHSNVSYAALILNPHLSYNLLETSASRYARWKTSLLYKLDQWGIRKM